MEKQEQLSKEIFDKVKSLCEKATHKDYEPTLKERYWFQQTLILLDDMRKWF